MALDTSKNVQKCANWSKSIILSMFGGVKSHKRCIIRQHNDTGIKSLYKYEEFTAKFVQKISCRKKLHHIENGQNRPKIA